MMIAGLQNLSLVDFPGHLASAVFMQGCNFRCGYCHNPDLVTFEKRFNCSKKEVLDFISRRKEMIEGVVITGGEPTLYNDLTDFMSRIKDMGFKIKLDTNGSHPARIRDILQSGLVDYMALDIKTSFGRYSLITGQENIGEAVSESIRHIMLSMIPYEFRTTCVPGVVGEEDFREIGELVKGAKKYCLQQFRSSVTFDKKFQDTRPYFKEDIRRFRSILEDFVEVVETRGI